MKVLFVSQELPPETGWGGIGTYVAMISRTLAAAGHDVHVLSVVEGQPVSRTTRDGVIVHRFPLPHARDRFQRAPETWRRIILPATVARLVSRLGVKPDVVECPDWCAEGLGLALRSALPLVVRLHSSARQLFPYTHQGRSLRGLDGRLAVRLEETTIRRANVVVSTGSNLAEVAGWIPLDERALHAIPAAVRLPAQQPYPESGDPRVVFVGRLESRKAPEVVMRAAPRVLAAAPATRFVFVGRDVGNPNKQPSSAWLRAEAERLGISSSIELLGGLDWQGVAAELGRAAVCVFPSRWECFPNVAAEASAVGRPIVVSSIPAFRELMEDDVTGRIVPDEAAESWADAIADFVVNPERAGGFGEAGSALIRRVSDPARLAGLALAAYEHAIERWAKAERAGRKSFGRGRVSR